MYAQYGWYQQVEGELLCLLHQNYILYFSLKLLVRMVLSKSVKDYSDICDLHMGVMTSVT